MVLNPFLKWIIFLAELVTLILLLLPQSLFNSFTCERSQTRQYYQSSDGFKIDNQVILIGKPEDLDATVASPVLAVELTLVEDCDLSYLNTRKVPDSNFIVEQSKFAMRLYETPQGADVDTVISRIGDAAAGRVVLAVELTLVEDCDLSYLNTRKAPDSKFIVEQSKFAMRLYETPQGADVDTVISRIGDAAAGRFVLADPNFITSSSALRINPCALPNSGGGGTGGGPFGDPAILDPSVYDKKRAGEAFINQWAFGADGIDLPLLPGFDGQEVRVGVFDTSPFKAPLPFFNTVGIALPTPLWVSTWDPSGGTIASNHGLFVAGLIHKIAPKSSIQLVRVLYQNGCGDLWLLNQGLQDYASRMSAWTGDLDETVINMSLGIPTENEADKLALNTLDFLIGYADQQGAIFVAAAGNDSPGKDKDGNTVDPMPMQIPASYDKVWGVMATNPDGSRSCFSNKGEVSAPGGQGGPADQPDGTRDPCAPRTSNSNTGINPCSASNVENCEYGLISLGLTRDGPQYMFWSGSSFAAPLVSGLIALAYEEGEKPQIECLMRAGVRPVLGALPTDPNMGIINIRMSLSSAALSACGVTP